jgi:hypothetical protein
MVEGFGTTFENDQLQHAIEVAQHVARRNSKRSNTGVCQLPIPISVRGRSIPKIVRRPINFDAQSRLLAIEIEHVRTRWMLVAKL